MRRHPVIPFALTGLLLLGSCGSETSRANDDGGDAAGADTSTSPSPTEEPTVGTYPAYPEESYRFDVTRSCFCPGPAGEPVRVTVRDGEIVGMTYLRAGAGHEARERVKNPPEDLTLAEIIKLANDTEADKVEVTWPDGQDYPSKVFVDRISNAIDDEVTFTITRVVPVD